MTGLAGSMQDSSIVRVWPHEVDSLLKTNPNIPIIDVRTELEFRTSHIFRSMNCDVNSPDFSQRIMRLSVENPVIVYDEDSSRSLKAAEIMKKLGFKRTYELCGGIYSWAREGKTFVSGESNIDKSTILK
jgi:rhodanese-related sulfurtransferase